MEEDEPSFLEAIDYSAESNDEDAEPENEHSGEVHEHLDHLDQLSDSETNHRVWGVYLLFEFIRNWLKLGFLVDLKLY